MVLKNKKLGVVYPEKYTDMMRFYYEVIKRTVILYTPRKSHLLIHMVSFNKASSYVTSPEVSTIMISFFFSRNQYFYSPACSAALFTKIIVASAFKNLQGLIYTKKTNFPKWFNEACSSFL